MVKQVKPLSDVENIGFGLLCGFTDVALFQPMNYWKNAVQQSLPFTLNPSLLYRGVAANLANNSFCVGAQFWLNGVWRKMITGGVNRDLSNIEKVGGGVFAGAASSVAALGGVDRCASMLRVFSESRGVIQKNPSYSLQSMSPSPLMFFIHKWRAGCVRSPCIPATADARSLLPFSCGAPRSAPFSRVPSRVAPLSRPSCVAMPYSL